jgi:hypothetical protein
MPKFKKGDKVRVRTDTASPFRGRIGTIDEEAKEDSFGFWYIVKFESMGFIRAFSFAERDLESIDGS